MSNWSDIPAWLFMLSGLLFFSTGSLGLLRFPDIYSRLHAVTKTDTLGLGLLVLGLALKSGSLGTAVLLFIIWLLVLASGAVNCQLLARYNLETENPESNSPHLPSSGDSHDL